MKKTPLYVPFCLALLVVVFWTLFFPWIKLAPFAPFLAILFSRATFPKALWTAFGCGLILDLLSSELRFGLHALNMTLTTIFLYPQKKHFFEDKATALSFFTAIIAAFSTLVQIFLLHAFDRGVMISLRLIFTDVLLMSLLDAVYAFLWFTCPMRLYTYIQKVGLKSLFKKTEEEESG